MANKFEIIISATDRATAVVRNVNRAISRLTAPITNLQASGKALSRELGLDKIGKGLVDTGRAAQDVGRNLSSIVAPLTAIVGASSIAGVLEFGRAWATAGYQIAQAAHNANMGTSQLQGLQGAARLTGVPVEALDHSLAQLGTTLEDALYGRNQEARVMLQQLGVGFHRTKNGAVDVAASFNDIARAISNPKIANNAPVQRLIASMFGLEQLLPMMREGPEALKRLTDQVQASGAVMSGPAVQRATEFRKQLWMLDLTAQGLRNSIGDKLIPIMAPMVERMTAWIQANRELIATKVAEVVDGVSRALSSIDWNGVVAGVKAFGDGVQRVVNWLGGWQNAGIALLAVMNAPLIAALVTLTTSVTGLGIAIGGTLIKVIWSLGAALTGGIVAPGTAAVGMMGALETGALSLVGVLGKLGAVAAAGAAGYGVGTLISKMIEGTKAGDVVGAGAAPGSAAAAA